MSSLTVGYRKGGILDQGESGTTQFKERELDKNRGQWWITLTRYAEEVNERKQGWVVREIVITMGGNTEGAKGVETRKTFGGRGVH